MNYEKIIYVVFAIFFLLTIIVLSIHSYNRWKVKEIAGVKKQFCVSLVFQRKLEGGGVYVGNNLQQVEAENMAEAFGKAFLKVEAEQHKKGNSLSTYTYFEIL